VEAAIIVVPSPGRPIIGRRRKRHQRFAKHAGAKYRCGPHVPTESVFCTFHVVRVSMRERLIEAARHDRVEPVKGQCLCGAVSLEIDSPCGPSRTSI
jgi:hypothetical protein